MLKDQAPWFAEEFVLPSDQVSCSLLTKKIRLDDSHEKLDASVREVPQLNLGQGLLKRITMVDLGETLMGKSPIAITNRSNFLARYGI